MRATRWRFVVERGQVFGVVVELGHGAVGRLVGHRRRLRGDVVVHCDVERLHVAVVVFH